MATTPQTKTGNDGIIGRIPTECPTLNPKRWRRTLYDTLLDARKDVGGDFQIIDGVDGQPMTYDRLILACSVICRALARQTVRHEHVGVLLPNVSGVAIAVFSLVAAGRVPAMLNYSAGRRNLLAAVETARIKTVLTSRAFVEKSGLHDELEALGKPCCILFLEDIFDGLTKGDKLRGFVDSRRSRRMHHRHHIKPDEVAVLLFTSGSEGVPKAVALTHANILANCEQFLAMLELSHDDRIFNALPVFHSFGMTTGLIAPIVIGVRTFLYPSPLHYRQIPPLVRKSGATILTGTDTFAAGWARAAGEEDFDTVRLVFLGAEKIKEATRRIWRDKFSLELHEGYGVTEASPVISANTLLQHKAGSAGKVMPGLEVALEDVPGIEQGGRLYVRGPNIMAGYIRNDSPGVVVPPDDGWHDTGDIVSIDDDGFIFVRGRAKRFAKVGGEMISLAAAEELCANLWPDYCHAVIARDHPRKGEELVLITDKPDAEADVLLSEAQSKGISEISVPRIILNVDSLPVLGTGKIDYPAAERIATDA